MNKANENIYQQQSTAKVHPAIHKAQFIPSYITQ